MLELIKRYGYVLPNGAVWVQSDVLLGLLSSRGFPVERTLEAWEDHGLVECRTVNGVRCYESLRSVDGVLVPGVTVLPPSQTRRGAPTGAVPRRTSGRA